MARQCDWFDCYKAADVSNVEYPLYCKKHGKAMELERRNFEAKHPNGVRPHEVDRLRDSYGGFQGKQSSVQKKTEPQSKDEDHWLWKKDDRRDTEWGWIIFGFVAAPICAMGGQFGVFLGGFSLMFAIWETAKKLLKRRRS